jgi:biopolymer transport protein ExbB/TolQ
MNKTRRKFRTYLIVTIASGVVMVISPFVGLLGTVSGMSRAFDSMGTSGTTDPGVVSARIGEVLVSTAAGLGVALVGLPVFVIFLVLTVIESRRLRLTLPPPPSHVSSQSPG